MKFGRLWPQQRLDHNESHLLTCKIPQDQYGNISPYSVCLSIYPSACLPIYSSARLSVCQYISACPSSEQRTARDLQQQNLSAHSNSRKISLQRNKGARLRLKHWLDNSCSVLPWSCRLPIQQPVGFKESSWCFPFGETLKNLKKIWSFVWMSITCLHGNRGRAL